MRFNLRFPRFAIACGSLAIIFAGLAIMSQRQFVPSDVEKNATNFIEALMRSDFSAAYALTHPGFAKTIEEFEVKVRHELSDPTLVENFEINFVHPKQTYGNLLRRWYRDRPPGLSQESVDFTLIGHGGSLVALFEVRMKRFSDGVWRVVYIQSHAG